MAGIQPGLPHEGGIAQTHSPFIHDRLHAPPRQRTEIAGLRYTYSPALRALQHGGGQRVFARRFEGGGISQDLVLVVPILRVHARQPGLAFGNGSGLVHNHDIDFRHALQGLGVAHQDTRAGAAADTHHHRHGRSPAKPAGATRANAKPVP